MSEQTTTNANLSPKEREALEKYREWQGADPSTRGGYGQYVADRMLNRQTGENITVGRAGVYVRTALDKIGEKPESSRGNGSGSPRTGARVRVPSTAEATIEASIQAYDESLARMQDRIAQAESDAEDLDRETFIADRTSELEGKVADLNEQLKAARAVVKAWKDDEKAQGEAFDAEKARLTERIGKVRAEVEESMEKTSTERDQLVKALDAIKA